MGARMLRKGLALAVILLFVGMCVVPSTAVQEFKENPSPIRFDGNTLYVGGSGPNNYSTIQSAIDDAVHGDTVFVYSGRYYEHEVVVEKSISIIGEDKNTTIIDGNDNGFYIINLRKNHIILQDLTVSSPEGNGLGIGIFMSNGASNCTINHCNIYNSDRGLQLHNNSKNNLISQCIIDGNGISCTSVSIGAVDLHADYNVITHCVLRDSFPIYIRAGSFNVINHCTSTSKVCDVELAERASYNRIANCTFGNNSGSLFSISGVGNIVENCFINNTAVEAFRIWGTDGAKQTKIINCQIKNSGYSGILFWGKSEDSVIQGCTFEGNREGIAFFGGVYNTKVFDCNFVNNGKGILFYSRCFFNRIYRNNFDNIDDQVTNWWDDPMFNFYWRNYWSNHDGVGPYRVYGFANWDLFPAKEPYDIEV